MNLHPDIQQGLLEGEQAFKEGIFAPEHDKVWSENDIMPASFRPRPMLLHLVSPGTANLEPLLTRKWSLRTSSASTCKVTILRWAQQRADIMWSSRMEVATQEMNSTEL